MSSNKVNVINDSVFSSSAEAIIIPRSTVGTVSEGVGRQFEQAFNRALPKLEYKTLGSIEITTYNLPTIQSFTLKPFSYIIYAVSVGTNFSTYEAITNIIREIGEFTKTNSGVKNVATTLLGTGAGGLDYKEAFIVIKNAFIEYSREDCVLDVFIIDDLAFTTLIKLEESSSPQPVDAQIDSLDESTRKNLFLDYLATYQCYLVGSIWSGAKDQSSRFFKNGIWENGRDDKYIQLVKDIPVGSVLFLKSTFAVGSKNYLRIKGAGVVVSNPGSGLLLNIDWRVKNVQYDIGGRGSYRSTVAKINDPAIKDILGSIVDWELFKNELFGDTPKDQNDISSNPTLIAETDGESRGRSIESTFLTDYYADKDLLNYELYASAIVAFINHKNTAPPLTIGIMAPWGKGKTSLMRFIQKKLQAIKPILKEPDDNVPDSPKGNVKTATFFLFKQWIDRAKERFNYAKSLQYPTVWFNAWKFQKNEQIWAGFAYEIIHQLVNQLPTTLAKEEFWLRLNLKRIDQEKLKNTLRFKGINKIFNALLGFGITAITFISSLIWHFPIFTSLFTCGPLLLISTFAYLKLKAKADNEKVDFDITKYIKQPDYASKRGYFNEVEEDLRDVMNLLISDDCPAVLFIDDLDRCSPNTVAEIVEAINLFISGDFPKCYFILGQDAQMVAASLDVAYDKISDKSSHIYREQGSLGWHFMEKFVQLQFCIPIINDDLSKAFFKSFFNTKASVTDEAHQKDIEEQANEISTRIEQATSIKDLLTPELMKLEEGLKLSDPIRAVQLQEQIIEKAANEYDDNDPEVFNLIDELAEFVGSSPRAIKRFINLYRFYKFLQLTNRNSKLQEVSSVHIGQWIIFMIRWPQLVRAIQWNTESNLITGDTALKRAMTFQKVVFQYANYQEWEHAITALNDKTSLWLKDIDLYNFINVCEKSGNKLDSAVRMGIW